jgi:hypothetical protein
MAEKQPRYKLNQVVVNRFGGFQQISRIDPYRDIRGTVIYHMRDGSSWTENYLRPLTAEEKGE